MLDPWIIEQIRRREEEHHPLHLPVAEIPEYPPGYPDSQPASDEDDRHPPESDRGVTIIDFSC